MTRHNTTIKTRRTDVIKRDVAPKFNESFSFKMTTIALLTYRDVEVSRPDRGLETNGLDLSRPNVSAGLKARIFISTSIWRPQFRSRPGLGVEGLVSLKLTSPLTYCLIRLVRMTISRVQDDVGHV